jgi:hypothetical protein
MVSSRPALETKYFIGCWRYNSEECHVASWALPLEPADIHHYRSLSPARTLHLLAATDRWSRFIVLTLVSPSLGRNLVAALLDERGPECCGGQESGKQQDRDSHLDDVKLVGVGRDEPTRDYSRE